MFLTGYEEKMINGEYGLVIQSSMEYLVKYGEALGASRLIKISNVHITLATPPALPQFVSTYDPYVKEGPKVFTTTHVAFFDTVMWREHGVPEEAAKVHSDFMRLCSEHGVHLTYTCMPFLVGNIPRFGEHIVWMESAAQVYANAVLGARTNREGIYTALASMVTARTPYWGLHIDENRLGTHVIKVETHLRDHHDYATLGYFTGEIVGLDIPVFTGNIGSPGIVEFKNMGAALATSGGIAMFHIPGITPEARSLDEALGYDRPVDEIVFDDDELRNVHEKLSTASTDKVDVVMLGCPHMALPEIEYVARKLRGKKIKEDVKLFIAMPRGIKAVAERSGYIEMIEKAGGIIISDACPAIMASGGHIMKGIEEGMVYATDSAKQAHYASALMNVETLFGNTDQCIEAALTGRWRD